MSQEEFRRVAGGLDLKGTVQNTAEVGFSVLLVSNSG